MNQKDPIHSYLATTPSRYLLQILEFTVNCRSKEHIIDSQPVKSFIA